MAEILSIGALSKQSGVSIETIRYYERRGVLPNPPRSIGGFRLYSGEYLRRLAFVRRGRDLGFSLETLRGLIHLTETNTYTCEEVYALTQEHLTEVRRKIADLRRVEQEIVKIASHCSKTPAPECPVIDALVG